jgi:Restriction endonuclease
MPSGDKAWRDYEEVAAYLLDRLASEFGLERVEGKQHILGSTDWEIDAKGVKVGGEGFVIIECRRHTRSKQSQEQVAGLAYRIVDTGASGGIYVSPLGFQEGAKKVAATQNVHEVVLRADSTRTDYTLILEFLNKVFVGLSDTGTATEAMTVTVIPTGEAAESSTAGSKQ